MRCKLLAVVCLLVSSLCSAQNLEIYQPPQSGQGYTDLFTGVNLLGKPHVNGVTLFYPWSTVDKWSTGPCTETSGNSSVPCNWSAVDGIISGYITGSSNNGLASHGQKINLVIEMVPESGSTTDTTQVPSYVYAPTTYSTWCSQCVTNGAVQDVVTCGQWSGSVNAPTCSNHTANPPTNDCATGNIQAGVWNANVCHLTGNPSNGGASCGNSGPYTDFSGFPVVYEQPIMTAYEKYVDTVLKHYSPLGSAYTSIGQYLGYIRIGLANGGENLPICTSTGSGNSTLGVWPSPQGLSYGLSHSIPVDWFATTPTCPGGSGDEAACEGKYAYLHGSPNGVTTDGNGYMATIWPVFEASVKAYSSSSPYYKPYIMAGAHSGPPGSSPDPVYAQTEASIIMSWPCLNCEQSGFGEESLNEYDLIDSLSDPCTNDWCDLFSNYEGNGGNLYLQTETPNPFVTSQILSIDPISQKVTCTNPCPDQASFAGSSFKGLQQQEGFALPNASGGKYMFKIANNNASGTQGVLSSTTFTLDPSTTFNTQNITFPATLYVGDYLPDTIPFAKTHFANTIEVYFCDWEFAYNNGNSPSLGCQSADSLNGGAYANILSNP